MTQPLPGRRLTSQLIIAAALVALAIGTGYLAYQLQQTNSQLQHRIDLTNHYTGTCTGTTSSDGLVFTETCRDSYGTTCVFTETFGSATNPSTVSSTTTCTPAA